MKKVTIKQRLIILLTIFIVSLVSIGIYMNQMEKLNEQSVSRLQANKDIQKLLTHVQFRLAGISNDERAFLLTGDRKYEIETEQKRLEIEKDFSDIAKLYSDSTKKQEVTKIKGILKDYYSLKDKMFNSTSHDQAMTVHFNDERTLRKQTMDPEVEKLVMDIKKEVETQTLDHQNIIKQNQRILMIIILVLTILTLTLGFYLIRSIFLPLKTIQVQLDTISKGEGDLTKEIIVNAEDELGSLAQSFNTFIGTLRNLFKQVGTSATEVNLSSQTLQTASYDVITATQTMNMHIKEVASSSESQSEMMNQSNHSVKEMVIGISQISNYASNVAQLSSSATSRAEIGTSELKKLVEEIDSIHELVRQSLGSILSLERQSNDIGNILNIIKAISDQTNLLALNAAIEAARAGEAGKGFAVVADEVRKLAEQSLTSTNQIAHIVSSVQKETRQTVNSFDLVKEKVDRGRNTAQSTEAMFKGIIESFGEISTSIQEISATTEQLSAGSTEVSSTVSEINSLSNHVADLIQRIADYSDVHLKNIATVQQDADKLSNMSTDLNVVVAKFKV
ncbi:methyl-accepting chemotaxis protein [Bacillus sp. ISL-18]|nr:HAMP domain-containing methyl-accepting chemotaxis protein [Bacillus sp. ISL-18]MBT2655281.1 methyl-accepting chemotaxis protein [Bacillus sp. ISL-18]